MFKLNVKSRAQLYFETNGVVLVDKHSPPLTDITNVITLYQIRSSKVELPQNHVIY